MYKLCYSQFMSYRIALHRDAKKALVKIGRADRKLFAQLEEAIGNLAHDPRPDGCRKLTGRDGYRIRVREYRVIYLIDGNELVVTVVRVASRGSVYE